MATNNDSVHVFQMQSIELMRFVICHKWLHLDCKHLGLSLTLIHIIILHCKHSIAIYQQSHFIRIFQSYILHETTVNNSKAESKGPITSYNFICQKIIYIRWRLLTVKDLLSNVCVILIDVITKHYQHIFAASKFQP